MKTIIAEITFGLLAIIGALYLMIYMVHYNNTAYLNAIRYADEHDCKCLSSEGALVFVFDNGSLIGRDVMYREYDYE